jgi:hypothetical protein
MDFNQTVIFMPVCQAESGPLMRPTSPNYALPAPELRRIATQLFNEIWSATRSVSSPGAHMPNRTAKFVSAIIVSFMAGAPFAAMSQGATPATDNCLASPPKDAPQGGHWHYRIEHPSNRHCWYLRAEQAASSKVSTPAPTKSPSLSTNAASAMPGSVANARAELVSPQTGSYPDASIATGQAPAAATGPEAGADNPAAVNVQDANMLRSVVASRWPDQLAANNTDPEPVTDNSDASAPSDAVVTPQPPAAAVPLTAAEAPPARQSSSTQMLIIAIVGALSVAGLAASVVGFSGRRKNRTRSLDGDRRAIWETTFNEGSLPSPFPAEAASRPQIGLPKELREADEPDDRIAEMLVRLARSAQA